jgi:putative membrane protein
MVMESWAEKVLNDAQKLQIETAVAKAELLTNAEIVPMIVRRSSEAREGLRGFIVGAELGLLVCYILAEFFAIHGYSYVVLGTGVLGYLASFVPKVARLLIGKAELSRASEIRAELEFSRLKMTKTKDHVGILVFVSEFDHKVVVLADEAIAKVLPGSTWTDVCSTVISGLIANAFSEKLIEAIGKMGTLCASAFPPKSVNINEMENHIIIKD